MKQAPPVLHHRDWRFLLRDFTSAHPQLRPFNAALLKFGLAPAAAAAWWLAKTQPQLLERDELHLVVPGASTFEAVDGGRWFAFLPWLLGRPDIRIAVTLVGDEVRKERNPPPDEATVVRRHGTAAKAVLASKPPSTIFEGTLGSWLSGPGASAPVDACVLFSPGIGMHYKSWFGEQGLLELMRLGVPVGHFGYSKLDSMEDLEVMRLLGLDLSPTPLRQCPWYLENELTAAIGGYAQFQLDIRLASAPDVLEFESDALHDFDSLQNYARHDYETFGGDQALERLGRRRPVYSPRTKSDDAIVLLPYEHGILESTRQLGYFDEEGFTPFEPDLLVPAEHLANRPGDDDTVARYMWALRLHRDWVAPTLDEHESDMFGAEAGLGELLEKLTGSAPGQGDIMEQLRAAGGVHGPTHPSWWTLLEENLDWDLEDYDDECERLDPAFWAPAPKLGISLPVICEAYAYFPDDDGDKLAQEAMRVVAAENPEGAMLLFKSMPYTEVGGHKYHFGGMLYWAGKWTPFAMTEHVRSADDVLAQVESGFSFETGNPNYADDDCRITIPFNFMCYGLDPNAESKVVGLRAGKWTTLMPG